MYNHDSERLEKLLEETISLIEDSFGSNPFEELNRALKIIKQRNYSQYSSINKKMRGYLEVIYGRKIKYEKEILDNLNEIFLIISKNSATQSGGFKEVGNITDFIK